MAFNHLAEDACLAVHAIITSPSLAVPEGRKVSLELIQNLLSLIECVTCMNIHILRFHLSFCRTLSEVNLLVQERAFRSGIHPVIIPDVDLDKVRVEQYQQRLKNASSLFTGNSVSFVDMHAVCRLYG